MDSINEDNRDLLVKLQPKRFHFQVEGVANNEEDEESNSQKWTRGAIIRRRVLIVGMAVMLMVVVSVFVLVVRHNISAAEKQKAAVISLIQARSPSTTFHNATSPQQRALDWLLSDKFMFTESLFDNNDDRVVQRFAMAVFYYATGGPEWAHGHGWLDASTECRWGYSNQDLQCNQLDQLTYINLFSGGLHGSVPRELGLLSDLIFVDLGDSIITGAIPSEIGLLTSLIYLRILSGSLEAPFPTEIGMLSRLTELNLRGNNTNLTGRVPTELANLIDLTLMYLGGNQLTGTIPFPCDIMHKSSLAVDCDKISCGGCCYHDDGNITYFTNDEDVNRKC